MKCCTDYHLPQALEMRELSRLWWTWAQLYSMVASQHSSPSSSPQPPLHMSSSLSSRYAILRTILLFTKFTFQIFFLVALFGMFHALVFLPVLLSIFSSFLRPHSEEEDKSEDIQLESGEDNKNFHPDHHL